ncbi:MAG: DUF885 domain-containing protein [Thermoanaerobaculia bacterium]
MLHLLRSPRTTRLVLAIALPAVLWGCAEPGSGPPGKRASTSTDKLVAGYLERYFETFPTRATAAGRHEWDDKLEDLGEASRDAWVDYNRRVAVEAQLLLEDRATSFDERLDLELLNRQNQRVLLDYESQDLPGTSPLFWSGKLSNATVLLLVRDDVPLERRLESAAERARLLPGLAAQAREALESGEASRIAPEHASMAARQLGASAIFYRKGFAKAAGDDDLLAERLETAGRSAAEALEELAEFLSELAENATGTPRLGSMYARRFQVVTGVREPVESVLEQATRDLEAKRAETAAYGRSVWPELLADEPMPESDIEVVRRLFERVSADRAEDIETFIEHYRTLIADSTEFVRSREIVTLPEPLTVVTDRSPSFFIGQSVGGVYPAGPYASAEAATLLFLPTPSDEATPEQKDAFFRDFNEHFNTMITPHEIIPGHYLQLKYAARHPHKIRALFGDGVFIEGWGTFAERLMLDQGWGGPLDRLAHLKKQLENIARTIVDIRVHTQEMSRDEVLRFVRDEALQDAQFAGNMWRRAITSSPQLTSYYLGYRQVHGLYEETRALRGSDFVLREFMDGMMELGPVPIRHYRAMMLD